MRVLGGRGGMMIRVTDTVQMEFSGVRRVRRLENGDLAMDVVFAIGVQSDEPGAAKVALQAVVPCPRKPAEHYIPEAVAQARKGRG